MSLPDGRLTVAVCDNTINNHVAFASFVVHQEDIVSEVKFVIRIAQEVRFAGGEFFKLINEIVAQSSEQSTGNTERFAGQAKSKSNGSQDIHLVRASQPRLLINQFLILPDTPGDFFRAEFNRFTKSEPIFLSRKKVQYTYASMAQGFDGKIGAGAGQIKRGPGSTETQGIFRQMVTCFEQAAVFSPAVVAEPGKKIHRLIYINLFDNRNDLARFGTKYYLSIIIHIPNPLLQFFILKRLKIQIKNAACRSDRLRYSQF